MQTDYKKRHIETEIKFYKKMNKNKTFLLTVLIVGIGSFFLYIQYWSTEHSDPMELIIWTVIVVIMFVSETLVGHSLFEYERKKYIQK